MDIWIADFFSSGHSFEYIMDMCYWDFIYLTQASIQSNISKSPKGSSKGSRNLRPVQKDAISKRKNM